MKLDCDPYSWFQGLVNLDVLSKKKKRIRLRSTIYKVMWQGHESLQHQHSDREVPPSLPWEREKTSFAPHYSTVGRVSRTSKLESILLHCVSLLSN